MSDCACIAQMYPGKLWYDSCLVLQACLAAAKEKKMINVIKREGNDKFHQQEK
jgi:hypothetical protein